MELGRVVFALFALASSRGVRRPDTLAARIRFALAASLQSICCRFSCRLTPTFSGIGKGEQRQITPSVNDLQISCRTSYSPSVA
jgi:hypothetical protein